MDSQTQEEFKMGTAKPCTQTLYYSSTLSTQSKGGMLPSNAAELGFFSRANRAFPENPPLEHKASLHKYETFTNFIHSL